MQQQHGSVARPHRGVAGRPALLRRHPDPTSDYSSSHLGRGADYDADFAALRFRAVMWQLEQQVLRELVTGTGADSVLDFACGTGRITEALATELPAASVIGVDIADSMLEVARRRVPRATFVAVDGTELHRVVPAGSVDLAAAFRFFANADPLLRRAATAALADAVRPGGHLLLNNHRNFWSPSYVVRRARPGAAAPGARNVDVLGPFLDRGFEVVARRSLGLLPASEERVYGVPEGLAHRVEWFNLRHLSAWHAGGSNTIWLLRRNLAGH
jgi:SAM-dependent methyltransferase